MPGTFCPHLLLRPDPPTGDHLKDRKKRRRIVLLNTEIHWQEYTDSISSYFSIILGRILSIVVPEEEREGKRMRKAKFHRQRYLLLSSHLQRIPAFSQ